MKKVQNYFSYLKTSVLSTEELFELFRLHTEGKNISPYRFDDSEQAKDLSDNQKAAAQELLKLGNQVAVLSRKGITVALIGYVEQ